MNLGSLFAGYGGLCHLAAAPYFGARTVWTSDIDPGACKIIAHRMPSVPNLGDITKIDWALVEPVDVLTGGFPCTDVSHAGKRAGMRAGTRSGLWSHMAYAVEQLRPRYVIAENVRGLLSASADSDVEPCPWCMGDGRDQPHLRALGVVLADLASLGYDSRVCGLRAAAVGAPHGRFRIFVLATDTRGVRGNPGWIATPGQAPRRWPLSGPAGRCGTSAGDADGARSERPRRGGQVGGSQPYGARYPTAGHRDAAPDPSRDGRDKGRTESAGLIGGPDAAQRGPAATGTDGYGLQGVRRVEPVQRDAGGRAGADVAWGACEPATPGGVNAQQEDRGALRPPCGCGAWGQYTPVVHRWELVLNRPAPAPTEVSPKGSRRLAPRAVEFMMGLPEGWVTGVPGLSRNAQLKALGNGVVPQQALAALRILDRMEAAA